MKLDSFWTDTAPPYRPPERPLPARADVAIVGGGFTGLSTALALARRGARVVVLEAGALAAGASGRNGGHVNNGLSHDYAALADAVGTERAAGWYRAYDAAVDTVARIVTEEDIDCDFTRNGKLKLAARPAHYEALARTAERLQREVDPDVELIAAARIREEIDSDLFHGGILMKKSAQMHMGKFGAGIAAAAERHGAELHPNTTVERFERTGRDGQARRLHTNRGTVEAAQVVVATGTTRLGSYGSFGWWRRRLVPVGSFIVVTEPLGRERAQKLLSGKRTYTTTANLHHYFRLSPDDRLVFGGRARFAMSNPLSDEKSGAILKASLAETFPRLGKVRIDYCWGGLVDITRDRLPRAGLHDGLYYAMGYSGHGVQMSIHMGQCMARMLAGEAGANPWGNLAWHAIPGHIGPPWFLPAVGLYYKIKDRLA